MNKLAEHIFNGQLATGLLTEYLEEEFYGYESMFFDYYDASIEFEGCNPNLELPDAVLEYLYDQGFHKIWLRHGTDEGPNKETYYSKERGKIISDLAAHRIESTQKAYLRK